MNIEIPVGDEQDAPEYVSKSEVDWDKKPKLGENPDAIEWHGTLPDGRRVYELYRAEPSLYAADTHEEIETE